VLVVDVREDAVELALALAHAVKRDGLLALLRRVGDGGAEVRKAIKDFRHVDRIKKKREARAHVVQRMTALPFAQAGRAKQLRRVPQARVAVPGAGRRGAGRAAGVQPR
jgi:hypothetical protein